MSSNAGRSTFPGHFSSSRSPSPPSSPSFQPGDTGSRKDNGQGLQIPLAAGSDFNLPGAYPASPRMPQTSGGHVGMPGAEADSSMRGAMQRLPSGEVDADATRGLSAYGPSSTPDRRGSLEGDFGSKDTSVEEAEKSVGSMTLNAITEENRTSSLLFSFFSHILTLQARSSSSNARGTWNAHTAEREQGESGRGRERRRRGGGRRQGGLSTRQRPSTIPHRPPLHLSRTRAPHPVTSPLRFPCARPQRERRRHHRRRRRF